MWLTSKVGVLSLKDTVKLDRNNFNQYQFYETARTAYKNKRENKLVDRVFDAIMMLIRQEQELKDNHSDAAHAWDLAGRKGEPPKRGQAPLEKLFEQFTEIFPNLQLTYNKADGRLIVKNLLAHKEYGPSSLSDGEKQVFSLLADLLQLEEDYSLLIVDEPELNLHPELAERVWSLIESEYPEMRFIYATHSIQFALRSNVDTLYVISSDPSKISKLDRLQDLPRAELERFLGGVPGILNAGQVVVTEGHEKSFDSIFFRWVLADPAVEVFPCGSSIDVKQVIAKESLWQQISSDISLVGIIDSDFRGDKSAAHATSNDLITLNLHEAESYLCLPEIICDVAAAIGSQDPLPSPPEIEHEILSALVDQKLPIALRRAFSGSELTVRLSLERSVLSAVSTKEQALALIRDKSNSEISKAVDAMSEATFERRLDAELAAIELTIAEKDIRRALYYLPGKELLNRLATRAGCKNAADLARSARRNLKAENYAILKQLAGDISLKLA